MHPQIGTSLAWRGLKFAANKQQIHSIHIFCLKNLLTILNQEINFDPELIAVLTIPSSYGICTQTFLFVYGQPDTPLIVESAKLGMLKIKC